ILPRCAPHSADRVLMASIYSESVPKEISIDSSRGILPLSACSQSLQQQVACRQPDCHAQLKVRGAPPFPQPELAQATVPRDPLGTTLPVYRKNRCGSGSLATRPAACLPPWQAGCSAATAAVSALTGLLQGANLSRRQRLPLWEHP